MKLKIHIALFIISCMVFFSCRQKEGKQVASYQYSLQETGKILSHESDKPLVYSILAVFPFTDKTGRKYLTFQEYHRNRIHIYEMYSGKHYKTLEIDEEGPDGITQLHGYFIKDFDEIYLTNSGLPFIARTDTTGRIVQKISYAKSDNGMVLLPSFTSVTVSYTPLVIVNDTFYVTQVPMPGKEPDTWPVSCYIDTIHHSVKALPFCFPPILKANELRTVGTGAELSYSRCFDGSRFVYSFYFEESITVTSQDHREVQKIPAKSKYIERINPREKRSHDMFEGAKRMCEAPSTKT